MTTPRKTKRPALVSKVVKACGWTPFTPCAAVLDVRDCDEPSDEPPDYLNDLNAMHEAEKILEDGMEFPLDRWYEYGERLAMMIRRPENIRFGDKPNKKFPFNGFGFASLSHLTAAQRAEVFLKTLNLWKD